MAFKTLQNTALQADVQAADIIPIARGTGALSHTPITALVTFLQGLGSFLLPSNNLSDLASAATARTNLGVQPTVAPSFTGGATVAGGLTVTGGVAQSGATVQSVNAVAALDINWPAQDWHTKSISANSVFTFSGFAAAKAQGIVLDLTITSAAVPTWPASVKWSNGTTPTLGNGRHILGFLTDDGGSTVVGIVGAIAVA